MQVRLSSVKLLLYSRMDDKLRKRIACVNLCERSRLVRGFYSDPRFNGQTHAVLFKQGEGTVKKAVQRGRILQKAGSPAFCDDCTGRTSEIQVKFLITHIHYPPDKSGHHIRIVHKQLGNGVYAFVVFRKKVVFLLSLHAFYLMNSNRGHKIGIDTRKMLCVCHAVRVVGDAFHRRKFKKHRISFHAKCLPRTEVPRPAKFTRYRRKMTA